MEESVVIFLLRDKKFLLQLRDNKPSITFPNFWGLLGGHKEIGESPLEAIKRELSEEIDSPVKAITFIGTAKTVITLTTKSWTEKIFFFKGSIDAPLDNIQLFEGQKLGYFTFEEVMALDMPDILKKILLKHKNQIFS